MLEDDQQGVDIEYLIIHYQYPLLLFAFALYKLLVVFGPDIIYFSHGYHSLDILEDFTFLGWFLVCVGIVHTFVHGEQV